ncbi:MBL fold metallo-hydrolase [uncultured Jatrophihabitans sp.]|uniref:MBL fold metallo-hydrolase n=1 Tax=uncultured Jatrophihabitans sp. TaxID=1610747 RepID=UPI0035CB8553
MRIDWWGHASLTVELGGLRVLTDPVLTAHVAHLARVDHRPPPSDAARADVVIVSHLHADHLHVPSLRRLGPDVRLVAPRGAAALLRRPLPELSVDEVGPGEVLDLGGVTLSVVPARHDGRRLPGSRHVGPALGYVLAAEGRRVWFAGDTGLFDGMRDIGPVDIALVPVGGWGPTLGPEHLDPVQAAEAVRRVGAADAVPIHYATLWPVGLRSVSPALYARKCQAPGREFAAALDDGVRAHVLRPGQGIEL